MFWLFMRELDLFVKLDRLHGRVAEFFWFLRSMLAFYERVWIGADYVPRRGSQLVVYGSHPAGWSRMGETVSFGVEFLCFLSNWSFEVRRLYEICCVQYVAGHPRGRATTCI